MLWNSQGLHAGMDSSEAWKKWWWIRDVMMGDRPAVIALLEVHGGIAEMRVLRKLARAQMYDMVYSVGAQGKAGAPMFGVVLLWCRAQIFAPDRVAQRSMSAPRTLCANLKRKCDGVFMQVAALHGEFAPAVRLKQLQFVQECQASAQVAITLADFNAVPCRSWRVNRSETGASMSVMQDFTGWSCSCCRRTPGSGLGGTWSSRARLVGGKGTDEGEEIRWTRFKGEIPTSRIDFVVDAGLGPDRWELVEDRAAEGEAGSGKPLSDHLAPMVRCKASVDARKEQRATAVARGMSARAKQVAEALRAEETAVSDAMRAAAGAAEASGGSQLEAAKGELVDEARQVEANVDAARDALRGKVASSRGVYNQARGMLHSLHTVRRSGVAPSTLQGYGVMHRRAGLSKRALDLEGQGVSVDTIWLDCIRKMRRQERRAAKLLRGAIASEEKVKALKEAAKQLENGEIDFIKFYRQLHGASAGVAMEAMHVRDDPKLELVAAGDEQFSAVSKEIGEIAVRSFKRETIVEAAAAWAAIFIPAREEIVGSDGNKWAIEKEFTFDLFKRVLHSMPRGKAVGQSGFSVELLVLFEKGGSAQRAFFDALMADLKLRRIASTWRIVIYALLVKPPPNRKELVCERREIAIMEQDMKLVLQMGKRAAYSKGAGRVLPVNCGWTKDASTGDASMQAASAIQQSVALGRSIWLLFVDLKQFFSMVNREVLTMQELMYGLPPDVIELTHAIYATYEGGVECRFDSSEGLGGAFRNDTGTLMGCVLSPDKAKIFMDSIIRAVDLACRGVRLWGAEAQEVLQMAFGDDWLGTFGELEECQRAWGLWSAWAGAHGMVLGVKGVAKTAVSGVQMRCGVAGDIDDPRLELSGGGFGTSWRSCEEATGEGGDVMVHEGLSKALIEGRETFSMQELASMGVKRVLASSVIKAGEKWWRQTGKGCVPVMTASDAYKHLGIMLTASGEWAENWKLLKRKVGNSLARLARLHGIGMSTFETIADVLVGGLVGFYAQGTWMEVEEMDQLEAVYRKQFIRKFGMARGTARLQFYAGTRRTHAWAVGAAAFYTQLTTRMADVEDVGRRRAARSCVARAAAKWGCREDPLRWDATHILEELEKHVREAAVRDMGEAWWLASLKLRRIEIEKGESTAGLRTLGEIDAGDPLHVQREHFAAPSSMPLFGSGWAMPFALALAEAGVVAVGHWCRWEYDAEGEAHSRWFADFDEAARLQEGLLEVEGLRRAWAAGRAWLLQSGIVPEDPEMPVGWREAAAAPRLSFMRGRGTAVLAKEVEDELTGRRSKRTREEWLRAIKRAVGQTAAPKALDWSGGHADARRLAEGPCIFSEMPCGKGLLRTERRGGEASWGGRHGLDDEGFAEGWRERARELLGRLRVDEVGALRKVAAAGGGRDEGVVLSTAEAAELGPALEMMVRATARRKEWSKERVEQSVERYVKWQERVEAQVIISVDGSRKMCSDGKSEWMAGGFACVTSEGEVKRQRIDVPCNYRAEMRAQMDAAKRSGARRVMLVFDASSPVAVLMRFIRLGGGRRGQVLLRGLIDEWWEDLQGFEAVVFLWQTSHSENEPANEWADEEADKAAEGPMDDEAAADESASKPRSYASMEVIGVERGLREWAKRRAAGLVRAELQRTSKSTQVVELEDVDVCSLLHGAVRRAAFAVMGGRCQIGDERRFASRKLRLSTGGCVCPFGCALVDGTRSKFTWFHVQFECKHPELQGLRRRWIEASEELQGCFTAGKKGEAAGWTLLPGWVQARARCGQPSGTGAASSAVPEAARTGWAAIVEREEDDLLLRRVVGGAFHGKGLRKGKKERAVYGKVVEMGLQLQLAGWEATAEVEKTAKEAVGHERLMRPYLAMWRSAAAAGGPLRAKALADVRLGQREALKLAADGGAVADGLAVVQEARRVATALPFWGLEAAATQWRLLEAMTLWRVATLRRWAATGVLEEQREVVQEVWRAMGEGQCPKEVWRGVSREGGSATADAQAAGVLPLELTVRWAASMRTGPCAAKAVNAARGVDFREGRASGRGDRWVLDTILGVERPAGRKGRQLSVQVQWKGSWGGRQVEWLPISWLNEAAKREAREMEAKRWPTAKKGGKRKEKEGEDEATGARRRKSPRLTGEEATGGMS